MKARPEPMSIPLIFVPAFMGTELKHKDCYQKNNVNGNSNSNGNGNGNGNGNNNDLVYVNWKIGLNLSTPDLSLPLKWDCTSQGDNNDITSTSSSELSPSCLPVQAKDDIVPGGAMEQMMKRARSLKISSMLSRRGIGLHMWKEGIFTGSGAGMAAIVTA